MENNLYHWHNEMMVSTRMEDVWRETEQIQLLQDAGLYNPGFLDRMAMRIEKGLVRLGLRLQKNYSERQQAYHVTTKKYAA